MVSVWPIDPNTTCWFATNPIERTECAARALAAGQFGLGAGSLACAAVTAFRDEARGGDGGPGGGVLLVAVVVLDDLGLREVLRRLAGELHHEHRAGGEVGRVEQARALGRAVGQGLQLAVSQAGRADDAIHAPGEGCGDVAGCGVGLREVHHHVRRDRVERLGDRRIGRKRALGRRGGVRVDAADDAHVVRSLHGGHDGRAHAAQTSRYRYSDHIHP